MRPPSRVKRAHPGTGRCTLRGRTTRSPGGAGDGGAARERPPGRRAARVARGLWVPVRGERGRRARSRRPRAPREGRVVGGPAERGDRGSRARLRGLHRARRPPRVRRSRRSRSGARTWRSSRPRWRRAGSPAPRRCSPTSRSRSSTATSTWRAVRGPGRSAGSTRPSRPCGEASRSPSGSVTSTCAPGPRRTRGWSCSTWGASRRAGR